MITITIHPNFKIQLSDFPQLSMIIMTYQYVMMITINKRGLLPEGNSYFTISFMDVYGPYNIFMTMSSNPLFTVIENISMMIITVNIELDQINVGVNYRKHHCWRKYQ